MTSFPFVHLHCHSHYSFLDGVSPIPQLVRRTKELGMNALALTDHGNLHGALEFHREAVRVGIKPIIGYEAYVVPGHRSRRAEAVANNDSFHLTLLAENRKGFQNLVKLASAAYLEGLCLRPHIDRELLANHHEGLICLSGCESSELSRAILRGGEEGLEEAMKIASWHQSLFGDRYLLEIQNNGLDLQRRAMDGLIEVARRLNIDMVATGDVHCVDREDAPTHKLMQCFRLETNLATVEKTWGENWEFHLRSPQEMYDAFEGMEQAVWLTQELADLVDCELDFGKSHFPAVSLPETQSPEDFLRELCHRELRERYQDDPTMQTNGQLAREVGSRLERELRAIHDAGTTQLFLLLWDILRFARSKDISYALRGSGLGSLVCYALRMSHVCPLRYGLSYEPFLENPDREIPNIQLDLERQRYDEVLQYVRDTYGRDHLARVGWFVKRDARSSIRRTSLALGVDRATVDSLVDLLPKEPRTTIQTTLEQCDEFRNARQRDDRIDKAIRVASRLEGLAGEASVHPFGWVLSDRPLTDYVPLRVVDGDNEVFTQWEKTDLERLGLGTLFVLRSRHLDLLAKTRTLVEESTGVRTDYFGIPLDDEPTFEFLRQGRLENIRSYEKSTLDDLFRRMTPRCFSDIMVLIALQWKRRHKESVVEEFFDRKNGKNAAEPSHPMVDRILEETHGILLFEEQAIEILHHGGRVDMNTARSWIKMIRSQDQRRIQRMRVQFINGIEAREQDTGWAERLFDAIVESGDTMTAKISALVWAWTAYSVAYFKTHWPEEFGKAVAAIDTWPP